MQTLNTFNIRNMLKPVNIIIAGGSGLWSEKNHYPAILSLKNKGLIVRVVAICDPVNPYLNQKGEIRNSLKQVIDSDRPVWIDTTGKQPDEIAQELDTLLDISAIIVATNPVHHFFYCKWALSRKINILCDKPIVTTVNSSSSPKAALGINKNFEILWNIYAKNRQADPSYLFCSPLRRRALEPFVEVQQSLQQISDRHQEDIRHMSVVVNGGIHKFPLEYLKGGAHGHIDGVGTLSHTSYHYIDIIAWYLKSTAQQLRFIDIELSNIIRVKDYLATKSYSALAKLIGDDSVTVSDHPELSTAILETELDFVFTLKLNNSKRQRLGTVTFTVNYTGFAPRQVQYDPEITEYAHSKKSGRMSSVFFDIHQGALQQWQIHKNDEAIADHKILLNHNLHPLIGDGSSPRVFENAYEGVTTTKDLFKNFIELLAGIKIAQKDIDLLSSIDSQKLTMRIYSAMYEKIAEDSANQHSLKTIDIRDYI